MTQGEQAVVLFGHGARDPEWARPMLRAQAALQRVEPALRVELAFLEFMQPTLAEAIDRLVASGAGRITVVPVFLAQGGHLKKDVPLLVEAARGRHPRCDIRQVLAVGEADGVVAAIAGYAAECARS
nr:CbiX/SirB N-terminal domain-containing protein [Zoogloeaceae bacterium]